MSWDVGPGPGDNGPSGPSWIPGAILVIMAIITGVALFVYYTN